MNGECKFGADCEYKHPKEDDKTAGLEEILLAKQVQIQGDKECNICYEYVLKSDRKFGLMSTCEHPFCLECIRKWRATYSLHKNKEFYRLCPICRTSNYYVVPSSISKLMSDQNLIVFRCLFEKWRAKG